MTVEKRTGRLPAELTSFVGRRAERAEARRLLGQSRLVTLMGPGGVGKTRLAVRVADDVRHTFEDGVRFVDLAGLQEPGLLARTVGDALGLPDQGAGDALDLLAEHLADLNLLLVLDTCEHLVDGCALLAEVLLRAAGRLRILATSRQSLDIPGEHTLQVDPLAHLAAAGSGDPPDSVALFADRAGAVVPGWSVTADNHPAVTALCHRLDGIPLAIELAVVQLRALSVEQMLARLDSRLLRVRGRRTRLARHQTLQAALDWSHQLCSPAERLLWARLSVFAGDFDLDAAEAICADADLPAAEVVELLAGLIGKSIVLRADRDGHARYRMLDTIREYGAEDLARLGQTADLRTRAVAYYGAMITRARAELAGPAQPGWLAWFHREQANIRAVIGHALCTAGDDTLIAMALGAGRLWALQGLIGEARHWAGAVLEQRDTSGPQWAEMLALSGYLATLQNDLDAARGLLARAEESAGTADDARALMHIRAVQGVLALYANEIDASLRALGAAAELQEKLGGPADVLIMINDVFLGLATTFTGDTAAAAEHAARAVRAGERQQELWCRSYGLVVEGLANALGGDSATGLARSLAGLRIKRDLDDRLGIALALEISGGCYIDLGEPRRGVRLLGAADETRSFTGTTLFGPQHAMLRTLYEDRARELLGPDAFKNAYDEGAAAGGAAAVAEALADATAPAPDAPAPEPGKPRPADHPLTPRETEIAALVAEGLSNREIAERLVIAKRTVDSHLEHILAKFGFSSRTQIASWAARALSPEDG